MRINKKNPTKDTTYIDNGQKAISSGQFSFVELS